MRILAILCCLIATDLFAQIQPFKLEEENGFTWRYYRLDTSTRRALNKPIKKILEVIVDISKKKAKEVASQFPALYDGTHIDTVFENRIKWAAGLMSGNDIAFDSIYFGVGPVMYTQTKQKCRMITFVYDLPGSASDKAYKNQIKVTFLELADSFDMNFRGALKPMTLMFNRASDQVELDRLRNAFR